MTNLQWRFRKNFWPSQNICILQNFFLFIPGFMGSSRWCESDISGKAQIHQRRPFQNNPWRQQHWMGLSHPIPEKIRRSTAYSSHVFTNPKSTKARFLFTFFYLQFLSTLSETQYDWRKIEPVTMKANFIHFWCVESEFMIKNWFHNWTSELGCIWHIFGKLGYFWKIIILD